MATSPDDWNPALLESIGTAMRSNMGDITWVLDLEKGEVVHTSYEFHDEELDQRRRDHPEAFRDVPGYRSSGLLHRFVHSLTDDDLAEACWSAMRGGRGAYRRVRRVLQDRDLEDLWFAFQREDDVRNALEWLADEGLVDLPGDDDEDDDDEDDEVEATVRPVAPADRARWLELRSQLWPGADAEDHADVDAFLAGRGEGNPPLAAAFVAEIDGAVEGFVELSIRDYASGCTGPTPYIEGLYVSPERRQRGVGQQLVDQVVVWATEQGHRELASDADLTNSVSHAFHARLGFEEEERIVVFRRALPPGE